MHHFFKKLIVFDTSTLTSGQRTGCQILEGVDAPVAPVETSPLLHNF